MITKHIYSTASISIRRLARTLSEPVSTVGRWVGPEHKRVPALRYHPVSGNPVVRAGVRRACEKPRHRTFGYRRIWALLRREGMLINKKAVWRIMHDHLYSPAALIDCSGTVVKRYEYNAYGQPYVIDTA
jgi:hypothetical protein